MTQSVYDVKLEELSKLLSRIEIALQNNVKETQQLIYAYERGKGSVWAARICALFFIGAISWLVQDKISSYETWNRTQDNNQLEIQKTLYALENRITKVEIGKYK